MSCFAPQGLRLLLTIILLNVLTTIGHYADNICYFADYPEPSWLNPLIVDAFWFVMTPFACFGYWYYIRGWNQLGKATLIAYCVMSLLVLGHYLIAPPWAVSFRINALIMLETLAALGLWWYVCTGMPITEERQQGVEIG